MWFGASNVGKGAEDGVCLSQQGELGMQDVEQSAERNRHERTELKMGTLNSDIAPQGFDIEPEKLTAIGIGRKDCRDFRISAA